MQAQSFWRWCRTHPRTSGAGVVVLALLLIAGAVGSSRHPTPSSARPSSSASPPAPSDGRDGGAALALLATIPIKGRAAKTGYSRAQFGVAWTDDTTDPLGHNGCDTRNDILRRDLSAIVLKPGSHGCAVQSGTLHDPYTAASIGFTRSASTSAAVQIDHVVALSDAWQTGAARWTVQTRTDLANDPLNLLAVDGRTNESKGDGDAATWLPPNKAYRCAYVARQVAVKARYHLWTTRAEHDAIAQVLGGCPGQRAPTETSSAAVRLAPHSRAPSTPAASIATSATTPGASYKNCAAVRAAGAAPLHRGDPGYSTSLDRDGDGTACE